MEWNVNFEYITNFLIQVRQFSNADLHKNLLESRKLIDYRIKSKFETTYSTGGNSIVIYPNGHDLLTEGQVSLELHFHPEILGHIEPHNISFMDVSFVVSVVDAESNRILGQSFSYSSPHPEKQPFQDLIDSYVSRRFLLANADRLLPNDTLTLEAEAKVIFFLNDWKSDMNDISDKTNYDISNLFSLGKLMSEFMKIEGFTTLGEPEQYHLSLDSILAERLRTESKYFEIMSATPMFERNSGYVNIPSEEFKAFVNMVSIMYEISPWALKFEDIFDVYRLAHRYMIKSVLDTCRHWLRLACRTIKDASAILDFVELYDDPILRSIAEEAHKGIDDLGESYSIEMFEEWTCIPDDKCTEESSNIFHFQKVQKTEENGGEAKDVNDMSHCYV